MSKRDHNSPAFRAAELAVLLGRHYPNAKPHFVAEVVADMQGAARGAVIYETLRCRSPIDDLPSRMQRDLTQADRDRIGDDHEKRLERMERRLQMRQQRLNDRLAGASLFLKRDADDVNHPYPAGVELGGDVRGPCARLHIHGQRGDGWGDGFAIY